MDKLLIWDIDGTLVNSAGKGRKAMDQAFLELYGIEDAFRDISMAGMLDPNIFDSACRLHGIAESDPGRFFSKYSALLSADLAFSEGITLAVPGICDLLREISSMPQVFTTLGTGNIEDAARAKLEIDGLNRYFPVGGFGIDGKERWQVIKCAVEKSEKYYRKSFNNQEVFVIGDTTKDVQCGKEAGYRTIAVATGAHSRSQLEGSGADAIFDNLIDGRTDFLDIIKGKVI